VLVSLSVRTKHRELTEGKQGQRATYAYPSLSSSLDLTELDLLYSISKSIDAYIRYFSYKINPILMHTYKIGIKRIVNNYINDYKLLTY